MPLAKTEPFTSHRLGKSNGIPLSAAELQVPIANDTKHLHFGSGQTETTVTLPPGQHKLQLVLGDWSHVPFNPPIVSRPVTIEVK